MMVLKPIYSNGDLVVVPLVLFVQIRKGSRVLDTYRIEHLEEAIRTCDDMADAGDIPYPVAA